MSVDAQLHSPIHSELGKTSEYSVHYDPTKLFAIPRIINRKELGIAENRSLPFFGFDRWDHYEVSWLNEKGKPIVAIAEIIFPCTSPNILESKSLKLYFNSLNQTTFKDCQTVEKILKSDLEKYSGSSVNVKLIPLHDFQENKMHKGFKGFCLDNLDIICNHYALNPDFLKTDNEDVNEEALYSDLLKSNCLVTNQPDWGSVFIRYSGKKINHAGLLQYIVSFRNRNEFSEQCIERIFMDIMHYCKPNKLTVYGRYTRRGGLDINPYRSTENNLQDEQNIRLCRQ